MIDDDLDLDLTPTINPEKLFDEKEYSTIIIGDGNSSKKEIELADYVTILVSTNRNREEKDEALVALKELKAQLFLMNAITKSKKTEQKAILIAACWETGLDFSEHFLFFIDLVCKNDLLVSFEALTVIQEMETELQPNDLKKAITKLTKVNEPNHSVTDMIAFINDKLIA